MNCHAPHLKQLALHPKVKKVRLAGTIAAFELNTNEEAGYLNITGKAIKKICIKPQCLQPTTRECDISFTTTLYYRRATDALLHYSSKWVRYHSIIQGPCLNAASISWRGKP